METVRIARAKRVGTNTFVKGYFFDEPLLYGHQSQIYVEDAEDEECSDTGWVVINRNTIGMFTGLVEDPYFIPVNDEPRQVFEGDILELKYDDKMITCVVAWAICGFLLGSHEFEDSYIWLTEVIETDGDYYWVDGAKLIGNKYDNPELLK